MTELKKALAAATLQILKPLVRILLCHGVSHSEFSEIARRAYVEVGFKDFEIENKKQTVSRVAVITGLSRKEVLRLSQISKEGGENKDSKSINRAFRVTNGWVHDKEFTDNLGRPKPIPLYGEQGSFSALVKRYSGDIKPGAILDELIRVGSVVQAGDLLVLRAEGYMPTKGVKEKIEILGICAADLLESLDHNINSNQEPWFQREIVYHDLPAAVAEEFQVLSREKSNLVTRELHQWLEEKKKVHKDEQIKRIKRLGLGIYYFESRGESKEAAQETRKKEI